MLLTISTDVQPATDLGYLLHKHPGNVRTVSFPFGDAHVFFPEAGEARCTAALLVEVDPVGLVRRRGRKGREPFSLAGYVNDRPYAASSFLSVVVGKVFGTAMSGRCDQRPELAARPLPFEVEIPVLPVRGGEPVLRSLFEPLGYRVEATAIPLDEAFPGWGPSPYWAVRLAGDVRLADLLSHLYVLLPVLDDDKHYWVGDDEARKLLDKGGTWLASHPARELISRRYLKHRRSLADDVLARLADDAPAPQAEVDEDHDREEAQVEEHLSLNRQRIDAVVAAVQATGASRVLDLGCGEGRLVEALLRLAAVSHVTGADVSTRALDRAADHLHLDELSDRQRDRVALVQAGLTYRDRRFDGFDVATLVEVVEHLDEPRLAALEQVVFRHASPAAVIVTTPNREHNVRFASLPAGQFRHRDHRFEWTRAEFGQWADRVAAGHGYQVRIEPIGPDDGEVGPPTQMAVFTR
ncbi:MAG TPA: 3' terminal RNA ribose 2'-O-methyltransferase Hen1 [Acidimicrobiales bacterium]|nr:3' terminal RNA ribose 2'-O-methyltransferase Hen1 [Acidimicrobiales bacterium]